MVAGTAREADAVLPDKIVFVSNRMTGTGVNNLTGDSEIFKMNPYGAGVKQLTFNEVSEREPILSPDGKKIVYGSSGVQTSNPEGDLEVYVMNALDGTGKKNLSNNNVGDSSPDWGRRCRANAARTVAHPAGRSPRDRPIRGPKARRRSSRDESTRPGSPKFASVWVSRTRARLQLGTAVPKDGAVRVQCVVDRNVIWMGRGVEERTIEEMKYEGKLHSSKATDKAIAEVVS